MKSQSLLSAAFVLIVLSCAVQGQQAPGQAANSQIPTFKKEAGLVVVDAVVTDKKGNYIRDLTAKDFRVFEDNKEQTIKGFSSETGASAPSVDQRRYLVLFFDDSTMSAGDQSSARAAALKFLETNSGPNRFIAVADFGGTLRIAQNFTTDTDRLKNAVRNLKSASVSPNARGNSSIVPAVNVQQSFAQRTWLLAVRDMAKALADVPGRKTLVLLSAGFPLNTADWEVQGELMAAIDACNKANVAVYPIDVRGVGTVSAAPPRDDFDRYATAPVVSATLRVVVDDAGRAMPAQADEASSAARLVYVQHGTGGGGRGGSGTSGGSRGTGTAGIPSTGARGGSVPGIVPNAPYSNGLGIVPTVSSGARNQAVLYELAQGTGGFVIVNSNDLLGGLQKISQEQNQYYLLSYTPPSSEEGSCHTLRVKVDRADTVVRSRSGYCNVRQADLLAGKPIEKQLEAQASGSQPGNVAANMQAPYFYSSVNVARVNLAIDIPGGAVKFEKKDGKQRGEVNVLGLAYKKDGTVAARFSDTAIFNFENKDQAQQFAKQPYQYQNQFEIGPGVYSLKVVFNSGGNNFGKLQMPLVIDAYDGKQLSISTVALSKDVLPANQMSQSIDATLLEDRKPLIAAGMEILPAGNNVFKKTGPGAFYFEIYAPLLTSADPPKVGIQLQVLDRKTGEKKVDMGGLLPNVPPGNPVVPFGMKLPLDKLAPGSYQLEVKAVDTAGNSSITRTTNFEVE